MGRISRKKNKTNKIAVISAVLLFCLAVCFYLVISGAKDDNGSHNTADLIHKAVSENISKAGNISLLILTGKYTEEGINYDKVFDGNVILGDSITEGISAYGFLREDQVYCEIGGSVMKSADIVKKAAAVKPENAFFAYGTNDMGMYSGNTEAFIEKYSSLIRDFMKLSPDTKIYVNSISPPSESKIASGGYFYKWTEFNDAIKEMCGSLGIDYIDNVYILTENPNLREGDGVHVSKSYYPYWLDNMIEHAGLLKY